MSDPSWDVKAKGVLNFATSRIATIAALTAIGLLAGFWIILQIMFSQVSSRLESIEQNQRASTEAIIELNGEFREFRGFTQSKLEPLDANVLMERTAVLGHRANPINDLRNATGKIEFQYIPNAMTHDGLLNALAAFSSSNSQLVLTMRDELSSLDAEASREVELFVDGGSLTSYRLVVPPSVNGSSTQVVSGSGVAVGFSSGTVLWSLMGMSLLCASGFVTACACVGPQC